VEWRAADWPGGDFHDQGDNLRQGLLIYPSINFQAHACTSIRNCVCQSVGSSIRLPVYPKSVSKFLFTAVHGRIDLKLGGDLQVNLHFLFFFLLSSSSNSSFSELEFIHIY
jgi:hypothetical protein